MSNGPQAASAIAYVPRLFESNSVPVLKPAVSVSAPVSAPNILLVGRNGSWGTVLLKSLAKFRSELSFVAPASATAKFVAKGGFDLILLDSTVTPEQRRQLASDLAGTSASVYYSFPVETGCWWLPALRRGRDCHGAPAFRRNEFPVEIERILCNQTEA
jgi:hypothetical protein